MNASMCFIGAGNLATHLSKAIQEKGGNIIQVYSRTTASAKELATKLNTSYTNTVETITDKADVYFIALKDSVVDVVLSQRNFENKLLIHCSGSLPLDVLKKYSDRIGVFYPLQTFSKKRELDFSQIPVFVESNNREIEKKLVSMAETISDSVQVLSSERRKFLHISAVFACNFVNHFYTLSSRVLESKEIPFDVIKPLIMETAQKVQEMAPEQAQTGPAVRFDENIINSHVKELEDLQNYGDLYKLISESIYNLHNKK